MKYKKLPDEDLIKLDNALKEEMNKSRKHLIYFSGPEGEKQFNEAVKAYYENNFKKI